MKKIQHNNINILRGNSAKVLVVTDAISGSAYERGDVMVRPAHELFLSQAKKNGFTEEDFVFVIPCPPIPAEFDTSESKISKFVAQYNEEFLDVIEREVKPCKAVLTLGKIGTRQLAGHAVQITKARGTFCTFTATGDRPVLPLLAPFHVLRRPELRDTYESDFRQISGLKDVDWKMEEYVKGCGTSGYRWTQDIQFLLDNPPAIISVDCETVGLDWHSEDFRILNISITPKKGVSYVIPVDVKYATDQKLSGIATPDWMKKLTQKKVDESLAQIRTLLANHKVAVIGHNLKFDIHVLNTANITVANWYVDTMQMAFAIDENMQSKSLDDCTRRWLPTHSGYADSFNAKTDKSRMDLVHHDEMLAYAGGDTDVTYRLAEVMLPMVKQDKRNFNTFLKIQMPALRTFVAMEKDGVRIDTEALKELQTVLGKKEKELYNELISEVPPEVLREFENNWNFGSQKFLVACLFGPNGVRDPETGKRLKPIRFTNATQKLSAEERIPSTSAKDHLPFFEHVPFVRKLMQYSKLQKVRSTYVGADSEVLRKAIKPLKTGKYPKALQDILEQNGIQIPKTKQVRRRTKIFKSKQEVVSGTKTYTVDQCGNIEVSEKTEASGFWQYLNRQSNTIHTSFLLHATNTGRCLTKDAKVLTNFGVMTMEEIGASMSVRPSLSIFVHTHTDSMRRVLEYVPNGEKPVLKITTKTGFTLRATANHPFWTPNGWIELQHLKVGDQVNTLPYVVPRKEAEVWRPIEDSNGYEVSNLGRVKSPDSKYRCGRVLMPYPKGKWGHVRVKLGRKGVEVGVHRLVAIAFLGRPEKGQEVRHLNGLPADNRASNLKWGTSKENKSDTLKHGRSNRGSKKSTSKLTDEDVVKIRSLKGIESASSIAKAFGVGASMIRAILNGTRRLPKISPQVVDIVDRIEFVGTADTFDLVVDKDHSFVANHFVVHNTSSRSPNLQNTPKRGEMAKEFRKIFLPPIKGWKFLELDYSQVELRVAAWMANESRMIQIYKEGGDIHAATAAAVTGVPFKKFANGRKDTTLLSEVISDWPGADKYLRSLSPSERAKATVKQYCDIKRYQAKAVNFGYLYGMWWKKFKTYAKTDYGIDYTDEEAEQTRINFFKNYPNLEKWHRKMKGDANNDGYVRALHGSLRRLPNVESFDDSIIQGSERQAVNAPVQRFASDLGLIAVSRIFRDAPKEIIRPVLFIHDAIVPCVHPDHVEEAAAAIKYYMENPPLKEWFGITPPFPLVADVSVGDNLGEMEELPEIIAKKPKWFQSNSAYNINKSMELATIERLQKLGVFLKD